MSANLVVDLRNTCKSVPSINLTSLSGVIIGGIVDLKDENTHCQVLITHSVAQSGDLTVAIQESDTTLSGDFVAVEASGTAQWNNPWTSGGQIKVNSGGVGLISGQIIFAGFERGKRYVRANVNSGLWFGTAGGTIGFVSQKKITGSGGGFTMSPQT